MQKFILVCKIKSAFKEYIYIYIYTGSHGRCHSCKDEKEGCNELNNKGLDAVGLCGLSPGSQGNFRHDFLEIKHPFSEEVWYKGPPKQKTEKLLTLVWLCQCIDKALYL